MPEIFIPEGEKAVGPKGSRLTSNLVAGPPSLPPSSHRIPTSFVLLQGGRSGGGGRKVIGGENRHPGSREAFRQLRIHAAVVYREDFSRRGEGRDIPPPPPPPPPDLVTRKAGALCLRLLAHSYFIAGLWQDVLLALRARPEPREEYRGKYAVGTDGGKRK